MNERGEAASAGESSMELAVGTRVGPYEIERQIGAGGMGVVYRALDHRLGRQVAIKVLPAALVADAERLRRFEQEARTIGALNHPNLVTLHDVGHHDNAPYLVTELLEGQPLRKQLAAGPLSRRDLLSIATEVAHGLAAAHGAGIVHRDIKPDNIFVLADGRAKILDFGIAKLKRDEPVVDLANAPTGIESKADELGTATGTGVVIGTPGYMAPEQLMGGAVDFRTDIFAFGVVLYEMVTRKRPFAADSHIEESYGIMKSEPVALPIGSSPGLTRIVLRCLEKRPEARFQSAADLAFALDAVRGDDAVPSIAEFRIDSAPIVTNVPVTSVPTRPDLPATVVARSRTFSGLMLVAAVFILVSGVVAITWIAKSPRRYVAAAPVAPAASGVAPRWPSYVEGGPAYQRVTYHAQAEWFARFSPDGNSVLYSARDNSAKSKDELAQKVADKERWHVMRSQIDRPTMSSLDINGRLLDVRADQSDDGRDSLPAGSAAEGRRGSIEQLALRKPLPDQEGGVLATVEVGTGAPLDRATEVIDGSFGPGDTMAIVKFEPAGAVIEFRIGTRIWTSKHGDVRNLRVSKDGQHVAFTEHHKGATTTDVVIVDSHGKERVRVALPGVDGLAWRDDREVWFAAGQTLRAVDLEHQQRVLLHGALRLELRDVDRAGRILVAPIDERFQLVTGAPAGPYHAGSWLDAASLRAMSGDGKTLAFMVANGADETPEGHAIYIGHTTGDPTLLGHGMQVGLVPDGSAAVVLAAHGDPIRLVATVGGGTTALSMKGLDHVDYDHAIAVATDGKHVIVRAATKGGSNRAWSVPLDGSDPVPLGVESEISGVYAASTDRIAYAENKGISIVPLAGGAPVVVLAPHAEEPLRFTSDGKSLFVMRQHGWPRVIERLELRTLKRTTWATLPITEKPEQFDLAISADGQTIAYSVSAQTSDLYVIRPAR